MSLIDDRLCSSIPSLSSRPYVSLPVPVRSVSGEVFDTFGSILVDFSSHSSQFSFHFQVARGVNPAVILGWDFLCAHQANLDVARGSLSLSGVTLRLMGHDLVVPLVVSVVANEEVVIPPWSETLLPIPLCHDSFTSIPNHTDGVFSPHNELPVIPACTLSTVIDDSIPVRVANPTSSPVTLYPGMPLGEFHPLLGRQGEQYCATLSQSSSNSPSRSSLPQSIDLSSTSLTPCERSQAASLLHEYADIFSQYTDDYGRTNLVKHTIPTDNSPPIRQRAYRTSPSIRQEIKNQCDRLLEAGIIEPSSSPWSSPVVMVKKKSGSYRFCVDYRKLNKVTRPDSHPLPRIDDTLDALAGNVYFSTMDLSSGYWQVDMDTDDKAKTAFTTGSDLFQFTVMPMGLRNAPSTFQRLMQLVLRGLHWDSVLVYLDDVIVFGRTFDEKLNRLRDVFDRLRDAGLKLRPDKCTFFAKEVTFLGHVISSDGVLPNPANIDKVRSWPIPRNVTELRAFLGLCSYYRRFVKNFAQVAQPLYALTKKGTPYVWSNECEHAFNTLRQTLISPPLMSFPVFSEPFTVHTDASNFAIGAVLTQKLDGAERVIAYASRTLSHAEQRWSTYDRELWAIVWSVRHFRHYLLTSKFTIITDHKPLVGLRKLPVSHDARTATSRRSRWALELDAFDWVIEHREGTRHANADALSRIPSITELPTVSTVTPLPPPTSSPSPPSIQSSLTPSTPPAPTMPPSKPSIFHPQHDTQQTPSTNSSPQPTSLSDISPPPPPDLNTSPSPPPLPPESDDELCASLVADGLRIHQAQYSDPTIRQVTSWVRSGSFPSRSSIPQHDISLRKYHSERKRLIIHDGILCRNRRLPSGLIVRQVVIPKSFVPHVLPHLHGSSFAGHFASDKAMQKADQMCYWPGMRADITDFCNRCLPCQLRRAPVPALRAPLQPMSSTRPFQRVGVDITEMPLSPRGNRYILVVVDYYTRYINLYPLPNQTAQTVADCLFDKFICQHGVPESIHSDQGRQFESHVMSTLCEKLGISKTRTTPYHPQSDGLVERNNRTLKREIGKRLAPTHVEWDNHLNQCQLAYNTTHHSTTGFTPFSLVHGREAVLPLSLLTSSSPVAPSDTPDDYATSLLSRLHFAFEQADAKADKARDAQKRQYDKSVRFKPYDIGDKVLMTDPPASRDKLAAKWKGPYLITGRDDQGITYHLKDESKPTSPAKVIHYNRLKPYFEPHPSLPPPVVRSHSTPIIDQSSPTYVPIFPGPAPAPPEFLDPTTHVPPPSPSHDAHARNHDTRYRTRSGRVVNPPDYFGTWMPSNP